MKKIRKAKKTNFIVTFGITLTFVVLIGLFAIFSYLWITQEVSSDAGTGKNKLFSEAIPSGDEAVSRVEEAASVAGAQSGEEEYTPEENVFVKEAADEECVTFMFAGDILFDSNYAIMASLEQRGGNIESGIMPEVIEEMKSADIMMLNNEFPYSDRGTPTEDKQFTFRAAPSKVSYLNDMGVDIVSLANNHAYDYGEEALLDTFYTLKGAGIHYIGAGVDEEEAVRPVYYIINDIHFAIISATQIERNETPDTKEATRTSPGVFRCWNGEKLLDAVREAEKNSDFVIVYVHWGTENQQETDWAQEKQAKELAQAGVDLIVGDHPHILQRIEIISGVPVFYSLGNFWFNSKTLDTGLLKATFSENGLKSCQFIPCLQSGCRTTLLDGAEKARVLESLRDISENVDIDADGVINLQNQS